MTWKLLINCIIAYCNKHKREVTDQGEWGKEIIGTRKALVDNSLDTIIYVHIHMIKIGIYVEHNVNRICSDERIDDQ